MLNRVERCECVMPSRRKLKGERELIADIKKRAKIFCDTNYDRDRGCSTCPLEKSSKRLNSCIRAYTMYLLEEK